jgi:hypothetical protein
MNYSTEGGSIIEKIHPASWGLFGLALVLIPSIATIQDGRKIRNAMFSIMVAIGLAALTPIIATGNISAGVGYLIDTILYSCAASCILLTLERRYQRAFGHFLLTVIIINALIALGEFGLNYPIWNDRSVALFNHPLELGLYSATAVSFVYLTNWSVGRKALSIIILICATLAAGARAASIGAIIASAVVLFVSHGWRRGRWKLKLIYLAGVVALAPVAWLVVNALGLSARWERLGILDESAMARITILQVFDLLPGQELWWGPGLATLNHLATQGLRLDFVENSIVVYVFQFGIVGSLFLIATLSYTFFEIGRNTRGPVKIGLIVFLLVALSNNTLSYKTPALSVIFLLAIAFRSNSAELLGRYGEASAEAQ